MTKTVTIVELDLVGYSDKARELEEGFSVELVARLEDQIQGFVDAGLKAVKLPRARAVFGTAGDNALVLFERAEQAHRFVRAVHEATGKHNARTTAHSTQRWFRSGAATGEVCFRTRQGKRTVSGTTIARAVRLEAAARPGDLFVDMATFQALPPQLQREYGPEETIRGKRHEQYQACRCLMLPGAPEPDRQPSKPTKPKSRPTQARRRKPSAQPGGVSITIGQMTGGQVTGKKTVKGNETNYFNPKQA